MTTTHYQTQAVTAIEDVLARVKADDRAFASKAGNMQALTAMVRAIVDPDPEPLQSTAEV